jgi:hypothetical protein
MAGMFDFSQGISGNESGGNYGALGPATSSGDRAYGKYQVMGQNVGPWTLQYLGRSLTPQQFLSDPDAQEKVFQGKFGDYVQKYGPKGAASAWFTGNPNASPQASDGYHTNEWYVRNFLKNAGLGAPAGGEDKAVGYSPLGGEDQSSGQPQGQQQGYNPATSDWGSALVRAASALASSSNPAQAYALGQSANQMQSLTQMRPDIHQIGTDVYGQPIFGMVTPQGIKRIDENGQIVQPGASTGTVAQDKSLMSQISAARANGASRDQLVGMLAPELQGEMNAMLDGRATSGMLSRQGPFRTRMMTLAHSIDSTFDENTFDARRKMRLAYEDSSPTSLGGQATAIGALAQHGDELKSAYDALGNTNFKLVNAGLNAWKSNSGDPAVNRYVTALNNYAHEASRYLRSGNMSDADIKQALSPFSQNQAPDAFNAALAQNGRMFKEKLDEQEGRWKTTMGTNTPMPNTGGLISKEAKASLDRQAGLDQPQQAQAAPAAAPGGRVVGITPAGGGAPAPAAPVGTAPVIPPGAQPGPRPGMTPLPAAGPAPDMAAGWTPPGAAPAAPAAAPAAVPAAAQPRMTPADRAAASRVQARADLNQPGQSVGDMWRALTKWYAAGKKRQEENDRAYAAGQR